MRKKKPIDKERKIKHGARGIKMASDVAVSSQLHQ